MGRGMRREKHNSECIRSASERRKMYSQQYSLVVSILCPSSFCTKQSFHGQNPKNPLFYKLKLQLKCTDSRIY